MDTGDGSSVEIVDEFCYFKDALPVDGHMLLCPPGFTVVDSGHWPLSSLHCTV